MMNLGQDSKEYAKKALEINANNLRAYYALAEIISTLQKFLEAVQK